MQQRPFALNLRHLRALSAVVELGTLSSAAHRVGISQPALTQGLAKLERQLGRALFVRRPDGLAATDAGRSLADRAAAAFAQLARTGGGGRGFARPERLMTATQLDAFLRVADSGSFVGAAAAGSLSQPALHRAVRDLEQVIGVPLVERRGRGIALTVAGRRVARATRLAAGELAAGIAELSSDPAGTGRVVVGAMPLARAHVLPRALGRFTRAAPGVTVEVVEGSWRELIEPLQDGTLDLTIGALRTEPPPGLAQVPLFTDRLSVIGRAAHPLAHADAPDPALLRAYPWIVGPDGTPLAQQWRALFGTAPPAAPVACGSVMVIRELLRDSDLLTLLSPDQVALEIATGVLATIGPPLPDSVRTIGVTTRTDWRPTAAQRRLLALLADVARELTVPENE